MMWLVGIMSMSVPSLRTVAVSDVVHIQGNISKILCEMRSFAKTIERATRIRGVWKLDADYRWTLKSQQLQ